MKKTYDLVSSMLTSLEFLMKDVEDVTDDNILKQEIRKLRIAADSVRRRTMHLSNGLYFKNEIEKYGSHDDFVNMTDEEFDSMVKSRKERGSAGR